jgi:dTDP-4-amino-4,6-dideoxygalactose transaminase
MPTDDFALFGGTPSFDEILPVGQMYFPSWERYTEAMRGIFERQYYTNQGPLTDALEDKLQQFLGVKHVICVTNATIGLMMAAQALGLKGKVITPSFTFIATAQSLSWAGIEPVFCDVDLRTQQLTPELIAPLITPDVSAILAVNLWGGSCAPAELSAWGQARGLPVYFDSAHAFGCRVDDVPIGSFGEMEIFSFHATKILSATEGGCVCTNDDVLAARLRNIRSSYGARHAVDVVKTANGRMSEAQAAVALMSLEDFSANRDNNARLFKLYEHGLADVPGLALVEPANVSWSNYQYLVCRFDADAFGISRDTLLQALKAENVLARRYFHPGVHRCIPYAERPGVSALPNTDLLCETGVQLPIGALVADGMVERICALIKRLQQAAPEICSRAAALHV